jgi:hypothetical protein
MKKRKQKLTLDRPATHQIKVPGHLDASRSDWVGRMTIAVEIDSDGLPVTTLTGVVADQAALNEVIKIENLSVKTQIKK